MKKKCLLVIPRMGNGGAERVMATVANNLSQSNEIRIVTLTDAESFYPLSKEVEIIGLGQKVNRRNRIAVAFSSLFGGVKAIFQLRKMIKQWKPDVMMSFLGPTNILVLTIRMLGGIKCKLVVSERCDPDARGHFKKWFNRNFYPKADVIVCQSEKVTKFFREKDRCKTVVIPNPIAADAIPPRFEGKRRHTVVGVGRLDPQKNFSMLINAFAKLPERFSDYTLEIYGGGFLESKLQAEINELGLQERAFLMGVKKGVMHYISDVALYVMSSDYEGFPNALAEAMATGLPVISTDFSTGVAKDLIAEENGIVVPVGDEAALVAAMVTVLDKEDEWESMSIANRALLDTLSEENIMGKWVSALDLGE